MGPNSRLVTAGLSAVMGLSSVAIAANGSGVIYLRGHVPVRCNIELIPGSPKANERVIELGLSREFCNAPRGYRVVLDHAPHASSAAILSGATRIALDESGQTVLWESDRPSFGQRQIALDPGNDRSAIKRLGLRIEVKY